MRNLLQVPQRFECDTCFNWWPVFAGLGGLAGLGYLALVLYKIVSFRLALQRGMVPARACLRPGDKVLEDMYLKARCPASSASFQPQECPVCLAAIKKRRRWAEFPCSHGLCTGCLWRLVEAQELDSACPLCRAKLFQQQDKEVQPEKPAAESGPSGES